MRIIIIYTALLLATINLLAQQDPKMSHFMENKMWYNAGYTSFSGGMNTTFLHRSQWIQHKGAPHTQLLSWDYRAIDNIGVGVNVIHDKVGASDRTGLTLNGAYILELENEMSISFGLKGGFSFVKLSEVPINDENDPMFDSYPTSHFLPKIGAGIVFKQKGFEFGISSPDLYTYDKNSLYISSQENESNGIRNINSLLGYTHSVNSEVDLKGYLMYKNYGSKNQEITLNAMTEVRGMYSGGVSYSVNNSVSILLGVQLPSSLKIGYAYEFFSLKDYEQTTSAHELIVSYSIIKVEESKHSTKTTTKRHKSKKRKH